MSYYKPHKKFRPSYVPPYDKELLRTPVSELAIGGDVKKVLTDSFIKDLYGVVKRSESDIRSIRALKPEYFLELKSAVDALNIDFRHDEPESERRRGEAFERRGESAYAGGREGGGFSDGEKDGGSNRFSDDGRRGGGISNGGKSGAIEKDGGADGNKSADDGKINGNNGNAGGAGNERGGRFLSEKRNENRFSNNGRNERNDRNGKDGNKFSNDAGNERGDRFSNNGKAGGTKSENGRFLSDGKAGGNKFSNDAENERGDRFSNNGRNAGNAKPDGKRQDGNKFSSDKRNDGKPENGFAGGRKADGNKSESGRFSNNGRNDRNAGNGKDKFANDKKNGAPDKRGESAKGGGNSVVKGARNDAERFGYSEVRSAANGAEKPVPAVKKTGPLSAEDWTKYTRNGRFGYIDSATNRITIQPVYDEIFAFKEGLACAEKNEKFGYIDAENNVVIPFEYDLGMSFKEGLACVTKNNKTGFIGHNGEVVVDFRFEAAMSFENGAARVKEGGKWVDIDKDGHTIKIY
ncbi:MAG: WG repeat-containing protein [Clostridiales bacterium]|jgi:hypothetical protein|nr:WG repeat-containing protein [Clostridiales bacterium]